MHVDLPEIGLIGGFLDAAQQLVFQPAVNPVAQKHAAAAGVAVIFVQLFGLFPKQRVLYLCILITVNISESGLSRCGFPDDIASFIASVPAFINIFPMPGHMLFFLLCSAYAAVPSDRGTPWFLTAF